MQYSTWPELFFMEFYGTYIHGDILNNPDVGSIPKLLFMHGENSGENRSIFNILRQLLLNKYHLSSCSFDFIGHGSTGGNWNNTYLHQRTQQATEVIDGCFDSQPLSIITVGTGIFNAMQLLDSQRIINLVFITPVLPPERLETLPLSLLVEKANADTQAHWFKHNTYTTLNNFQGNISLLTATQTAAQDGALLDWLLANSHDPDSIADRTHSVIYTPPDQADMGLMQAANQYPRILLQIAGIIAETVTANYSQVILNDGERYCES